jgi:phospholipase A1/A2
MNEPGNINTGRVKMGKYNMEFFWHSFAYLVLAICLVAISHASFAAETRSSCAEITDSAARLKCYDSLGTDMKGEDPYLQFDSGPSSASILSQRWELGPDTKRGTWAIRPYRAQFVLPMHSTNRMNEDPQSPTEGTLSSVTGPIRLDHTEAEFQLSLKTKAFENMFGSNVDLWAGYTQQSYWQVYNGDISRPFRETDYQPEMFAVIPTNYNLLGLSGQFISLGAVHQSNGRANPLSRSWNRIYAQFGFERGNFLLLVRPWHRLKEDPNDDNNPDINRYMGYGDVTAAYAWGRNVFTLTTRLNTATGYGAAEGTWSFPIQQRLRAYVKLFTGYGETLIDYNWQQTSIGVGVQLADWK